MKRKKDPCQSALNNQMNYFVALVKIPTSTTELELGEQKADTFPNPLQYGSFSRSKLATKIYARLNLQPPALKSDTWDRLTTLAWVLIHTFHRN